MARVVSCKDFFGKLTLYCKSLFTIQYSHLWISESVPFVCAVVVDVVVRRNGFRGKQGKISDTGCEKVTIGARSEDGEFRLE